MRKLQQKPLSFSTTMRNPQRIVGFISCLLPFENMILTSNIIRKVIKNILSAKLYATMPEKTDEQLKGIYYDEDRQFTESDLEKIIEISPQRHKEPGFAYGWDSRFDTFYKIAMEFGFIYYEMGKEIQISVAGHMLVDAYNENPINSTKIQNVFLNALAKYQTSNPFRKNANSNVPLLLLLNVLKKLKQDGNENDAGVFRQELPLFICWPNADYNKLYRKIKEIRAKHRFSYSDEYIYGICLKLLGVKKKKSNRFKLSQICGEAVDEYIRKMRSTGIISLRGNGRFLDINTFELNKINYIVDNYTDYSNFDSKKDYYEYMSSIDANILKATDVDENALCDVRSRTLFKFAKEYSKESVFNELRIVCKKKGSIDPILKLIPEPTRLEFLTSIALVQNFNSVEVAPNYSVDDEGLPTCTASGGMADIICRDTDSDSLFEVTLLCGGHDQMCAEIVPIKRHLLEYARSVRTPVFAVFVAPRIHRDTWEVVGILRNMRDSVNIVPFDIDKFITKVQECGKLSMLGDGVTDSTSCSIA